MTASKPRQAETFQEEISRLNRESIVAFNRGNIAACAAFYAEDALMLLPQRPPIRGRKAIEEGLRDYAASGVKLMPVEPISILSSGDIGCCAGTFRFQMLSEGSETTTETGKFVTVLHRQPDGSWKAVIDSFFADAQPD